MRASSCRWLIVASSTGCGINDAPALLKCITLWQPGVSERARRRSKGIVLSFFPSIVSDGLPDVDRAILGCRGDPLAIGRPRYRCNLIFVPFIGKDQLCCIGLPYMHGGIVAGAGNVFAIRGEGQIAYVGFMSDIFLQEFSRCCIPHYRLLGNRADEP